MKCGSCPFGDHYFLDIDEEIELVQCPFGDQVFHLAIKRCSQFPKRKAAEGRFVYAEKTSKTD